MTDKAISTLTATASIADADELVLNQDVGGGAFVTKRIAVSAFKSGLDSAPLASPTFTGTLAAAVMQGTSLALGGATIGSNALAVTGSSAFSDNLTVTKNAAGNTQITLTNTNNGTASYAYYSLSNGSYSGGVALYGVGFTSSGVSLRNGVKLLGTGPGGVVISATTSAPVIFATNDTERMRLAGAQFLLGYSSNQSNGHLLQVAGGILTTGVLTTSGTAATTSGYRNLLALSGGTWAVNAAYGTGHGGSCIVGVDVYSAGAAIISQAGWGVGAISFQLSGLTLQGSIGSGISGPIYWYATKICG